MISEISPDTNQQGDLLETAPAGDSRLMQALDSLNQRFGRGAVKVSSPPCKTPATRMNAGDLG